jgi:hypothetical protein
MTSGTGAFYDAGVTWLGIAVVCLALVLIVAIVMRPRAITLGSDMARASAAEERRTARKDLGPSPMPPGTYSSLEASLNTVVEALLDVALRTVVRQYAAAHSARRAAMREATSMDELYTLLTFASREAVFAMRDKNALHVDDALAALAMVDPERIDWRDSMRVIELVHHAAGRFSDTAKRFERAALLADAETTTMLREHAKRPTPTLEDALYTEIPTGLIERGIEDYAPARDLIPPVLAIAEMIRKEESDLRVTIAEGLPAIWVGGDETLVASASGTATISTGVGDERGLLVFLSEMKDAESANTIVKAARSVQRRDWAVLALARENLVCLMVARSFVVGVPNQETDATLSKFEEPIAAILADAGANHRSSRP